MAVALAMLFPGEPARAAPSDYRCQVFAFSPDVAKDGTGLCATLDYHPGSVNPNGDATAYLTKDGGRTWRRQDSVGLKPVASRLLKQVVFSPDYATDRTIYLHAVGRGLLRTTDDGDTWLPIAPLSDSGFVNRAFTPMPRGALGTTAPVYALADPMPAVVSPPAHVPVAGAVGNELQFLVDLPTGTAFAAAIVPDDNPLQSAHVTLYACDVALACPTPLHAFPSGLDWEEGWLAPDFATTGRILAVMSDRKAHRISAWVSADRGRTFTRWTALDRYLAPIRNAFQPLVTLTSRPGRTMYARISYSPFPHDGPIRPSPPEPPGEQVLRSDDAGRTWRRVSYGLAFGQTGRAGSLPWNNDGNGARAAANAIELLPDGRLVTIAEKFASYFGIFTSSDGGRTWRRAAFFDS